MCAVDGLGIPYLLGQRGELEAHEPDARQIIRVTADPEGEPTWTPVEGVALVAAGDGCSLAQAACPHINLFVSPQAAKGYLNTHALQGTILSIADAARAGRWLFGDLLQQLADAAAR
jgi:hypothetical protein